MPLAARLRFDPLLPIVAAALAGGLACVAPLESLAAAGASLALASRRLQRREWIMAALSFAVAWGRADAALSEFDQRRSAAAEWIEGPKRCAFRARVTRSPTLRGGRIGLFAEATQLDCEGLLHPGPLPVRLSGAPDSLRRGDTLQVISGLAPVRLLRNLDLPDPTPGAARRGAVLSGSAVAIERVAPGRGLTARIDGFRAHVRRRIQASFAPNVEAMARALVLGESDLSEQDNRAFQKSGLAHLLAVSGAHLVLAVLALVKGFEALLLRLPLGPERWDVRRPAAALGLLLAPLYADFAGGSGSAWRAALMLLVAFAAQSCGRRATVGRTLLLSSLIGWVIDPLIAFDISFLLSLAASAGLVLVGRGQTPSGGRLLGWIVLATRTTAAASLPCLPLLLLLAPELSLASVAGNLLAAPLGELVCLPLCLMHALLAPLPLLEQGAAIAASGGLSLVGAVAHAAASAPGLTVEAPPPSAPLLAALGLGLFGALSLATAPWQPIAVRGRAKLRWAASWGVLACGLLACCEWTQRCHGNPHACAVLPDQLRITVLDVGQGDSLLVDLPDGRLALIDGGGWVGSPGDPGLRVVLPTLRARRRTRLDIVVLSHPHPDHYGGLQAVTDRVEVGEVWDTNVAASNSSSTETRAGPYADWVASLRARNIPIRGPRELCARGHFPEGQLHVLAPCPAPAPELSANDNSFVLKVAWGGFQGLLMGDAEREAEERLLARSATELRSSFLKVGHHGSRTSTSPALLAAAQPRFAVLSLGARNRFGHPHRVTLQRLAEARAVALRTDQNGACQWRALQGSQHLGCFARGRVR